MGRAALWGFLVGTVLMTFIVMFGLALPSDAYEDDVPFVASFIASGIFGVGLGGIPGAFVGLVVGAIRRRPAALPPAPPPPRPPLLNDRWTAMVGRCELAVHRVRAAVQTVPPSPAREWLARIAAQFDAELSDVRRIADLGRALGADQHHPVAHRLTAAVKDFTSFEHEVGRVALQLFDQPSLDTARTHLEVLEQQLPHLGNR